MDFFVFCLVDPSKLVPVFLEVTKLKSSEIAHGIRKVFVLTFFSNFS